MGLNAASGRITDPMRHISEFAKYHRSGWLGHQVIYRTQVGSTNEWAMKLAQSGVEEGAVVLADTQIAGRGRLGRRWSAPTGSCLLMSLIFRPLAP